IFFRDSDEPQSAAAELAKALDLDLEWVHAHTRWLVRASEWAHRSRDGSLLLRGRDLTETESWKAKGSGKTGPALTPLQLEYLDASRKSANRRRRISIGAVAVAILALTVVGYLGLLSRNQARSRELAAAAEVALPRDSELAGALALEAVRLAPT